MVIAKKEKLQSVAAALIKANNNSHNYRSVLIVGLTKEGLHKDVTMFTDGDIDFQLIATTVNAISVDVAMGRIKI